jgi:UDPglucose 6-dehydrogenase
VIEESQPIEIAKIISEKGFSVIAYDPVAMENARKVLNKIIFVNSLKDAVREADVILISIPWEEFKNIEPSWLKPGMIIFDCWRMLDSEKYKKVGKYYAIGINS